MFFKLTSGNVQYLNDVFSSCNFCFLSSKLSCVIAYNGAASLTATLSPPLPPGFPTAADVGF